MSGVGHKSHEAKPSRPAPFSLRLSLEERAKIEAQAGSMPLASYIKSVVLADDAKRYRKRRAMPDADKQLLAEILAHLGASRTASNLNQIAKAIHCGTLVIDEALEQDLRTACAEVAWMRATLLAGLGLKSPTDSDDTP